MRFCPQCGSKLILVKTFPGKRGRVRKRERYKCTDPACTHEETIQPVSELWYQNNEREIRENQKNENEKLKHIEE